MYLYKVWSSATEGWSLTASPDVAEFAEEIPDQFDDPEYPAVRLVSWEVSD